MQLTKRYTLFICMLAVSMQILADGFTTAGNGTHYTLATLAQIPESGIKSTGMERGLSSFTLSGNITISSGDSFELDDNTLVKFTDAADITLNGSAILCVTSATYLEAANDEAQPRGIIIDNDEQTEMDNLHIRKIGVKCLSKKGLKVTNCTFESHNGVLGSAALTMGADGAPYEIRHCTFSMAQKAALVGAANYRNPLLIEDCEFIKNGQDNRNMPQLNLTVADSVVIRRCTIVGDPEKDMVGGIVVANLVSFDGTYNTLVEDCNVSDCRFGIATYMSQSAVIRRNKLVNNCHESNPMNGGSGINLYDPSFKQILRIEGNHIEGSLWGITIVGGKSANIGRTDVDASDPNYNAGGNTFSNNGNNGTPYDLYNNSANIVYAQGNTWACDHQTADEIEQVIFHKADNASLGEVIYMPAAAPDSVNDISMPAKVNNADYDLRGIRMPASSCKIIVQNGKKILLP